jgi:hypothetical protein
MMREELEADIRSERYQEWLDEQPKCKHCGTLWREEGGIYDENCDDYYCDQECVDNYENDRAESIWVRHFEGEGPVTARERQERLARLHKDLTR